MGNIADSFFTLEEEEYSNVLVHGSSKVLLPTANRIGSVKLRTIYADAVKRVQEQNPNLTNFQIWAIRNKLEKLLSIKENDPNKFEIFLSEDISVKDVLAQSLIKLVDEGLFSDTDMIYIENYLNLLLASNINDQEPEIVD